MDLKRLYLYVRGYTFLGRHVVAGKVVDKSLELLAFFDYRLHILLCLWHPDMETRIKLLRKRGVHVGENVFVDFGVFIDITHPGNVVIEDHALLGYHTTIFSHDAAMNQYADLPIKTRPTRIGYNCAIGPHSVILEGVSVGKHAGVISGSVVKRDVEDGEFVWGVPAEHVTTMPELFVKWQKEMKAHPENYFDSPHPTRAPSTPWDHLLTWREEGISINPTGSHRTGTPFDYIADARQMGKDKKQ
jgi:acetyltransferase-like isoleucine patch superfamily enzyme